MNRLAIGNALAALAFVVWGLQPLYYQYLPAADMNEMLAVRVAGTLPLVWLCVFAFKGQALKIRELFADKRSFFVSVIAGIVMCFSWYAFTWALTNNKVLESSLGFFINPLFVIAFGVIFMKERLSKVQGIAVLLAAFGLGYQIWKYGQLPLAALTMASFFAIYGLLKKYVRYDAMTALFVETLVLFPFSVVYLAWEIFQGQSAAFDHGWTTALLYLGSAPVTLLPLVLFSMAVARTSLSMIGLMQYIEPSLQFLLATLLFAEPFDEIKAVSFG